MTSVLSYCNEKLSIIMTDTRLNFGKYQEGGYDDKTVKLTNIPTLGWAAGAGFHDFIENFHDLLSNTIIKQTGDVGTVYKNALNRTIAESPSYTDDIESSVGIASWVAANFKQVFMRIGIFSYKHIGYEMGLVKPGEIDIVYPGDYLENPKKVELLKERFNVNVGEDLEFVQILDNMLEIFNFIANDSIYVSSFCDIGILLLVENQPVKLSISGKVLDILNDLRNGVIENRLQVIE